MAPPFCPHRHLPALRASPPAANPRETGSERRDGLRVWPPTLPPAGSGRVTSQMPLGGGLVTVGTQLQQKTYLLPSPFTAQKLGYMSCPSWLETSRRDSCPAAAPEKVLGACSRQLEQSVRQKQAGPPHILPTPQVPKAWEIEIFTPQGHR